MSERRLLIAALLLSCATVLPAQQDAALAVRRDSLRARVKVLDAAIKTMEASALDSGLTATVAADPLRLRTTATLQSVASASLADATGEARRMIGAEIDSLAPRLQLVLRENRTRNLARRTVPFVGGLSIDSSLQIKSVALEASYDGREVTGITLSYPVDRTDLATGLLSILERALARRIPAPLEPWLNHRLPVRETLGEGGAVLYRSLATADAAVARRCLAGDRRSCRLAFALDSIPADRLTAWYDPSDFPALARSAGDPLQRTWLLRSISQDEQDACVVSRQVDACRHMLALLPSDIYRIPMPDAARASLTRTALEIGGAPGLVRLREAIDTTGRGLGHASSPATIGEQLSTLSGLPSDELLARWMQQIMSARPSSPVPSATFVLASLACIGVCLVLATRGQPWR